MYNIFVNTRSSIKLMGTKIIYIDPLDIEGEPYDADLVFVTHEHYDHFSPEDIKKVLKQDTQIIVPMSMLDKVMENGFSVQAVHGMIPEQREIYDGVKCRAVPAYNLDKTYHPKNNGWLGYAIALDGKTYYAMGDTDVTSEAQEVEADVIFVPIGGKYTMDVTQAAEFINEKQPKLVVPIHYGDAAIGEEFMKLLKQEMKVQKFW